MTLALCSARTTHESRDFSQFRGSHAIRTADRDPCSGLHPKEAIRNATWIVQKDNARASSRRERVLREVEAIPSLTMEVTSLDG